MDQPGLRPGAVVRSLVGRDEATVYVVLRQQDERLVTVIDGDRRHLDRPKAKNRRHLEVIGWVEPMLAERLSRGERVPDQEVFKALRAFHLHEQKEV